MATANEFVTSNSVASYATPNKKVVFIGNPGVGKSTLLNCLVGKAVFKNGTKIATGLTNQLQMRKSKGVTYCDTPGLKDIEMQEESMEAILQALQQGGRYFVAFVITLESGRVKPEDISTIEAVLEGAPDITRFGLIINKLSSAVHKELSSDDDKVKLHCDIVEEQILRNVHGRRHPAVHLVPKYTQLEDELDLYMELPKLRKFIENSLKLFSVTIHKENVNVAFTLTQYHTAYERERRDEIQRLKLELKAMEKMRRDDKRMDEKCLRELKERDERHREELERKQKEQDERIQKKNLEIERDFHEGLEDILEQQELDRALTQSLLEF